MNAENFTLTQKQKLTIILALADRAHQAIEQLKLSIDEEHRIYWEAEYREALDARKALR